MIKEHFNLEFVHPSWHDCLTHALEQMAPQYLEKLHSTQSWLPGPHKIFGAFSLPVNQVNYLLFGESPYPREASANGYAFWDADVKDLWSPDGMSKKVNRATSLRNIMKMLLVAEGLLTPPLLSQEAIAALDKTHLVKTNAELFSNLLNHGFLLLNASLVLHNEHVKKDAVAWHPFLKCVIDFLLQKRPHIRLILLGKIANIIEKLLPPVPIDKLCAEHPYNHSFITNTAVLNFFQPLHLLRHKG
jgi:uracil-DNA glycosylase